MSHELQLRVGVQEARELLLELHPSETPELIERRIDAAVMRPGTLVWFLDRDGRQFGVASERIIYVELDGDQGT